MKTKGMIWTQKLTDFGPETDEEGQGLDLGAESEPEKAQLSNQIAEEAHQKPTW
jgi:hypothetical protein